MFCSLSKCVLEAVISHKYPKSSREPLLLAGSEQEGGEEEVGEGNGMYLVLGKTWFYSDTWAVFGSFCVERDRITT